MSVESYEAYEKSKGLPNNHEKEWCYGGIEPFARDNRNIESEM